ncbi:DUF551 domain-containing protein [Agrobacterium tumefaciens]|nr:DUF551 domain-containing protein [Agrobacterium tumefaciens]TQN55356.1 DUF551 domain-containing protein [Agrobacterium tumefaciens]
MQSETAISRELMGKIVDEVFDGAIEDTSVIEEIYAVIKREEAALSKVPVPKPLDLKITQDWFEKRAALEADHEIGAGSRKLTACIDPTPDELAELFKIAHRIPDGWQLVPVAALSAADPVAWQPRYKQEVIDHLRTVSDNVSDYAMTVFQTKEQAEEYGHGGHQVRALYAAQPAPSAAVKALEWRDEPIPPSGETLASSVVGLYCIPHSGDRFYLRFRDTMTLGDYSTLDKAKSAAQSDYEARIRSALSAQVQDVAGWRDEDKLTPEQAWTILCETPDITSPEEYPDHALITFEQLKSYMERAHNSVEWQDIITAPRDGTKILMRGGAYHGVPFPGYWETSPYSSDRPWVSIINDSRLYEHVPTHWMPLPAAPAKQEG